MAQSTKPALTIAPATAWRRASALHLVFAVLAATSQETQAQATCVPQGGKARVAAIEGGSLGVTVHFETPVDHVHSLLAIVAGNEVIRVLQPRFEAQPNTLFAETAMLAPGRYWLQWRVRSAGGTDVERGGIRFTIEATNSRTGTFVVAECSDNAMR